MVTCQLHQRPILTLPEHCSKSRLETSSIRANGMERPTQWMLMAPSIATDQRPYKYVVLEGQGRVSDDDREQVIDRIVIGYVGPDRGRALTREVLAKIRALRVHVGY